MLTFDHKTYKKPEREVAEMDQPSQQYPPWLTPVPSVVTNAAGSPVTVTGVSYIAPTYYGPSIPLGSLYSYGGYTFPPTVVWPGSPTSPGTSPGIPTPVVTTGITGATATATAPPITTELPTTATVPLPTISSTTIVTTSGMSIMSSTTSGVTPSTPILTTATPSSLTSTSVIPTSTILPSGLTSMSTTLATTPSGASPTSPTASSSTSSGAPVPSASPSGISNVTGLTKGQLVGIVVASVLGLIFLFVLGLFLYLWFKALKNRRQYASLSPIDDDYVVVPPGGRLPGEGSPRHSGEEHDSFLRPPGATAVGAASSSRPRGPHATANSNSSASTNSHASGFGVLLDKPSIGFTPSIPEEYRTGRPVSSSDLERLGREDVLPEEMEYDDGEYTGAYAYSTGPPVQFQLDPAAAPLLGIAALPLRRSKSGEPEEATVHTARRVKVEELGPRELGDPSSSRKSSNGILGAIGLGGLADLARRSWFKHFDSPRQSGVPSAEVDPISEKDIEAGHEVLATERGVDSLGMKTRTVVVESQDGTRPVSRVSAQSGASGATLYHDAQSSLQGASSLTPPPRALTPVEQPPMAEHTWASSPLAGPPVYDDRPPAPSTPPRNDSQTSFEFPAGADVLDMPAPTALTHFASISSKDSHSGSSFGTKPFVFPPPGLETIRAIGWADSPTQSAIGSCNFISGRHIPILDDPDVLEESPPEAENGWRSIATGSNRRGTFGTYVQGHDFASERASFHSHLSPSTRSAGSAPFGMGSVNSSRPSTHSRSASSGLHSLVHQGSIPSDLRRNNGSASRSPALSAFGMRPPSHASAGLDLSFDSSIVGTPPLVHVSPHKSDAGRSIASGSTTLFDTSLRTLRGLPTPPRSNSGSPRNSDFQLNAPPWVGGLAPDWKPAP